MASQPNRKALVLLFVKEDEDSREKRKSKVCKEIIGQKRGYTNMCNYILALHNDRIEKEQQAFRKRKREMLNSWFFSRMRLL